MRSLRASGSTQGAPKPGSVFRRILRLTAKPSEEACQLAPLRAKPASWTRLTAVTWNYGDSSMPEVGVTYFAGTFVRHPLAIAAASAVLRHLQQAGSQLYQSLNERAYRLAKDLNRTSKTSAFRFTYNSVAPCFASASPKRLAIQACFSIYLREKGFTSGKADLSSFRQPTPTKTLLSWPEQ